MEPKQTGICRWVGREARQVGYLEDVQRTEVTHSAYSQSSILRLFAKYKKKKKIIIWHLKRPHKIKTKVKSN